MTLTQSAGILAFYGILAFLPKSRIGNKNRFFIFYPSRKTVHRHLPPSAHPLCSSANLCTVSLCRSKGDA